ncbi:prenyltransferase/squalene oxidase repeat-containing protein [Streptomyces sp. NPDC059762]|uniref:prenyltransferase/squalene oxidase repeat-containing protein n=1 Tax=Streptomyces sp. NPDC059762 TaxID=3346938 RepID=UPI00365AB86D
MPCGSCSTGRRRAGRTSGAGASTRATRCSVPSSPSTPSGPRPLPTIPRSSPRPARSRRPAPSRAAPPRPAGDWRPHPGWPPRPPPPLARLVSTQRADGGWAHVPGEPADPISTAYALIALARTPSAGDRTRRAVRYLLERQRPDGGFDSRPDQAGPRPLAYHVPLLTDVCVLLGLNHAAALGHRPALPTEET